jgi:hypothetical protein
VADACGGGAQQENDRRLEDEDGTAHASGMSSGRLSEALLFSC